MRIVLIRGIPGLVLLPFALLLFAVAAVFAVFLFFMSLILAAILGMKSAAFSKSSWKRKDKKDSTLDVKYKIRD